MTRKEVERQVLAGLYKFPHIIADIDSFFKESFFTVDINKTIYKIIRGKFLSDSSIDAPIILKELDNSGYLKKDNVNIETYIESFTISDLSEKGTVEMVIELQRLQARRDVLSTSSELENYAKNDSKNKTLTEIISDSDKICANMFENYFSDTDPKNLYASMIDVINEKAKNPEEEDGLKTPFKQFNRLYGGFSGGNIYAFVARPKQGKTTLLNYLCDSVSEINKVPALMLDTEMETHEIQFRTAANLSGVPLWYIRTGNWVKNQEMVDKMKKAFNLIKNKSLVDHVYVANKDIDQVLSIIRRWYYRRVGKGNRCLISYDYIKLTGEKIGGNYSEHQAIGNKVDAFKQISKELNVPILTSMQLNRMAENSHNKGGDEVDSGMISLSDRLSWFASFIGAFVKKSPESLTRDGKEFGTHKMVALHTRYQGREAVGFNDLIKRKDENGVERYTKNYINFKIDNFKVDEKGTLEDIIKLENNVITQAPDDNDKDDDDNVGF